MLQKQDTYEGAQICLCVVAVAGSSADETEKIHLYLMFSVPGCHAGNVQFVAGGNRPSGVLQMERRYLCFYWETLDFLIREQVKMRYFPECLIDEPKDLKPVMQVDKNPH